MVFTIVIRVEVVPGGLLGYPFSNAMCSPVHVVIVGMQQNTPAYHHDERKIAKGNHTCGDSFLVSE